MPIAAITTQNQEIAFNNLDELIANIHIIEKITFLGNQIFSDGVMKLAKALEKNISLKYLDLACNNIGDLGVEALAKLLEKNQKIQFLNLTDCKINDKGLELIGNALGKNLSVIGISIAENKITDDGATKFAKILKKNFTLLDLTYDFKNEALEKVIARNDRLIKKIAEHLIAGKADYKMLDSLFVKYRFVMYKYLIQKMGKNAPEAGEIIVAAYKNYDKVKAQVKAEAQPKAPKTPAKKTLVKSNVKGHREKIDAEKKTKSTQHAI